MSCHALMVMTTFATMCMIPFATILSLPKNSFRSISCNLNNFWTSPYGDRLSAHGT